MIKRAKMKKTEMGIDEDEGDLRDESLKDSISEKSNHNLKRSIQWKSLFRRKIVFSFIRKHKKGLSVFCVAIMLTVAWFGYISKLFEIKKGEKEDGGPLIASQPVYHTNKVVVIDTDLIIEGLYQLDNSTLKVNGSADGSIKIEIMEEGNIRLLNNSKITWGDTGKYYNFSL